MVCIGILLGVIVAIDFCSLCVLSAIWAELKEGKKNG